ncbi:hypothetical protein [Corynebacterium phocae]|uniref:hypothetical protein n=1 Tax=Corynebacterium phocae TaxID=161895 RepID=UPI0009526D7B|nr:hypothetical protein [Corynebacterium phocae]KAA8724991.1 hypothetical protein F4V58_04790 [Corynebacterium phocae]
MTNPNTPYGDNNDTNGLPSYGNETHQAGAVNHDQGAAYGNNAPVAGYGAGPVGYENTQIPAEKNKLAPWALGVGILALLSLLLVLPPFLLGPIGIILAIIALVKGKKLPKELSRTWMSVVGLVTSVLALLGAIGFIALGVSLFNSTGAQDCMGLETQVAVEQCLEEKLNTEINGETQQ